ncbi:hypothetical protein [Breoghania sp. L-A4]|uniref:hypothetical protein n=1 Tax=Breoghania sp. L-A4 TaxID=2304600 RepID=UPI000E3592B4|nr:hypothetical protein [Breoghania sp. L-A4]AXS39273.1 hypothetical protein D1F64_03405 [Breoghania sp. L-A4]
MPSRFEDYRVKRGDNLGDPAFWNRRFKDLDARTSGVEDQKSTLDAVIEEGRTVFRDKANEVLLPLINEVYEIADVGAMLRATSATEHAVSTGGKTFVIDEGQRLRFAAPAYVAIYRMTSPIAAMLGEVVSYDSGTGELTVDIDRISGTGEHGAWTVTAASPSDTAEAIATVLAAVDIVNADKESALGAAGLSVEKAGLTVLKADEVAAFAVSVSDDADRSETAIGTLEGIFASQSQTYLGAFPSDPVTDLNGDALVAGAEYWNSIDGNKKIYDGSGWTVAYVPVGSEVTTIFGRTGNITAQLGDYSADKITSTAITGLAGGTIQAVLGSVKTALDAKASAADLTTGLAGKSDTGHTHAFGDLTGKPTTLSGYGITDGRTAAQIASDIAAAISDRAATSYVDAQIAALLGGAPAAALDTIAELAAALTDNDSDIAAIMASLATKLPAASYTAADVLAKLKTVDGAGSGIDAATAATLATPRTISLSGDATGSIAFDGSANVTIPMTVGDNSHAHTIANITSLQATLDAKALASRTISAGAGLTGGGDLGANRTLSVVKATTPQAQAGTGTGIMDAALTKAAIEALAPREPDYESAELTITMLSVAVVSHGLGVKPKEVHVWLICKIAQNGYAVGEEVPIETTGGVEVTNNGVSFTVSATSVDIITGSIFYGKNKSSPVSNPASFAAANWRYIVRAWL